MSRGDLGILRWHVTVDLSLKDVRAALDFEDERKTLTWLRGLIDAS